MKSWLVKEFNKTHLRNEERKKHGLNGPKIEALIPFWEFIDIEWDAENGPFISERGILREISLKTNLDRI